MKEEEKQELKNKVLEAVANVSNAERTTAYCAALSVLSVTITPSSPASHTAVASLFCLSVVRLSHLRCVLSAPISRQVTVRRCSATVAAALALALRLSPTTGTAAAGRDDITCAAAEKSSGGSDDICRSFLT